MGEPLAEAWEARAAALISDPDGADAWFERALDAHSRASDPFEEGRTELLFGEHLRRTRRRAMARHHLARAQALFQQLDAVAWNERAAQELRVAGGRSDPSSTKAALTPQEHNVVEAVVAGHSTREIADLLVLSPRTVETHLSSVYRKFGVKGRAALVAALTRPAGGAGHR
jgi:DNA-binding CsgD family transcriptional regulator